MRANQNGMSLVEVMVSLLLVVVVLFGFLNFSGVASKATRRNMDKEFAVQKAISMLEELRSLVQLQTNAATYLDAYDDGAEANPVLTTDRAVTAPEAPSSDNTSLGPGLWKFARQVSVALLPGTADPNVRLVTVRVFLNKDENSDGRPDSLAEVAGVIRTAAGNFPPTQVYDVYALAVENVPGWWVYMANLIPFVQNAIQNVQSRNPGLEFRVHWITKLSFGRDLQYRPQINSSVDALSPIENVYFYPGKMPAGEAVEYYYPPDNFRGHVLVDNADRNGYSAATNPYPYALADQYNHAMRYPDELALFESRVAAGLESDDAPTLRILLERLARNPERFLNSIFINLHGELFPFPPVRNYSDPAKSPADFPNIRVVTHPERLRYSAGAPSVKLRVYSYRTNPAGAPATDGDYLGQNRANPVPITVVLKGVSWTPAAGSIIAIQGGTDQEAPLGAADPYAAVAASSAPSSTGMYYSVSTSGGDTILRLYNSPLKSPEVPAGGGVYAGLNPGSRLYGLEYIPAPSEDLTLSSPPSPFSSNLAATHVLDGSGRCASTSIECEPNTARWVITIPADDLPGGAGGNGMLTVETRIDSTTSGTRTDDPPNLSRTYVWRGSDAWIFGDAAAGVPPNLPLTERYQFLGDPRHNPYADLKMPHQGSGLALQNPLGMGYNRYFDDFQEPGFNGAVAPYWRGYSYTVGGNSYGIHNGWKAIGGDVEIDMHRIYQVMRSVFAGARVVYTTMTGYSNYYCGLGNEIGYDAANNFPNSIPVNSKLLTGVSGSTHEQSILPVGSNGGVKYVRENTAGTYWWGINWLGELYPDSLYSGANGWAATGNLPTGTGTGRFVRTLRSDIASNLPRGTELIVAGRRTGPEGSTSYFWTGNATSTFHHTVSNGTGDLLAGGTEIAGRYSFPLSNGIPINRPFGYNVSAPGDNPDHFLQAPYGPIYTASYLASFYDHSLQASQRGSALLSLTDPSNNAQFVAVNGISMTGQSGSSFIANWSLLSLIQSFLAAGRYNAPALSGHVEQVPRVRITSPNAGSNLTDAASVDVGWSREWLRWDGRTYTAAYPAGYSESNPLSFAVMYSSDNGASWRYMQDGSPAVPGIRPSNPALLISSTDIDPSHDYSYSWNTPSESFPQGTYVIRVEAYRDDLPLHYAYHQYRAFLKRS